MGYLEVISGSMFSGKTEELLRRVKRVVIAKKRAVVVKPTIDRRYDPNGVSSHDGKRADSFVVAPEEPEQIADLAREYDAQVLAVDEAQFFAPGLVPTLERLLESELRIIVAGLDMDFARRPFGSMPELMALADEVTKLKAICTVCGEPATFNQRLVNGRPVSADAPVILVGGLESYQARCRRCHELPR